MALKLLDMMHRINFVIHVRLSSSVDSVKYSMIELLRENTMKIERNVVPMGTIT